MAKTKSHFRVDIQALRTVAVLLVVVFHFWPKFVTGGFIGVDVFFVISGFLITSHILRDVEREQFSIARFWARRVRRLLPASFATLATIAIFVVIFVPLSLWSQWLSEVIAGVFYFENWVLAANSVNYLALSNSASPTQHFWSLGVEEQFYLVWPLLIAMALLFAGKASPRIRRRLMFTILAIITGSSFAFAIVDTANEASVAYFSTPVRAWEFGVGALFAFMPQLAARRWSQLLAVAGFAAILTAGFAFTTKTIFPGWPALLPVLGTAAVIVAAANAGAIGKVLGFRPIQFIGDHSYSIYLWHWPILILAPYALHQVDLSNKVKLALVALSIVAAYLSVRFVERPLMSSGIKPNLRPRTVFATVLVASLVIGGGSFYEMQQSASPIAANVNEANKLASELPKCFGALAMQPSAANCSNPKLHGLYPSLDAAESDSFFIKTKCKKLWGTEWQPVRCPIGDANGKIRIAMVGDSHIAHYTGAFARLAKLHHWAVDVFAKGACPFTNATHLAGDELADTCQKFIPAAQAEILAGRYDLVVTSRASIDEASTPLSAGDKAAAQAGLISIWSAFTNAHTPVLVIKDNPRPRSNALRCLALKPADKCSIAAARAYKFDPQIGAVSQMANPLVTLMDLDRYFCSDSSCSPVIGHVVVYRDSNHLTNTFVETLVPFIDPIVLAALDSAKPASH